ncbi:MAG TPA: hypothetical protein PLD02_14860 [Saprospiraceae bacterium]|nr:hypothetical protein [Saprospiraceae bacterium]
MPDLNPYLSDQWLEKRKIIIARDNYTCQNADCNTFDPSSGEVQFLGENDDWQLHYYDNRYGSVYRLSSSLKNLTVEIDFGWGTWLVHPILQVHHLNYIQSKAVWEYEDQDLITLCRECHKSIHDQRELPILDSSGQLLRTQKFEPQDDDNDNSRRHNFEPWIFINKHTNAYIHCENLHPSLRMVILGNEDVEEIKKVGFKMVADFFEKYLPAYRRAL